MSRAMVFERKLTGEASSGEIPSISSDQVPNIRAISGSGTDRSDPGSPRRDRRHFRSRVSSSMRNKHASLDSSQAG